MCFCMNIKDNQVNIYTIGYGNRSLDEFITIILNSSVKFLIDIRSKPYSQFNPDFNKDNLILKFKEMKIEYAFMGDLLGGRPSSNDCYTDGKVDYDKLSVNKQFLKGLKRLENANKKNIKVMLMCSELKPQECHRSKLIGRALDKNNINILHIDENNIYKTQNEVILLATKGLGDVDLFGEKKFTSRKKYFDSSE